VDYHSLRKWIPVALGCVLLLLVLVLIPPLGREVSGAKRWIQLGRFSFQPAEIGKLVLIFFLADDLAKPRPRGKRRLGSYGPLLGVVGALFLLVLLQPDLGTAVLLVGVAVLLLFVGGVPILPLVGLLTAALPFLYVALAHVGFRRRRLVAFWDPWSDRGDSGFQVVQSLLALGKGGVIGVGPGAGTQKLFFLPEAHTDFVFAMIGEEFGFIGCTLVLALFGVLLWSGMSVAWRSADLFGRYLASGMTSMILLQAIFNMAVVAGLLPTKGLPLPFVSLGGSSLLVTLLAVGILLGISARIPAPG
jgi:cell division protein FtsW